MDEVNNSKRTLNILWNVYVFSSMYMAIDKFNPEKVTMESVSKTLRMEDKWLLSKLEGLKIVFEDELKQYSLHRATRELENFILDTLSRWYVKLIRNRLWSEKDDESKIAAYKVLHEVLSTLAKLMAPITPYISESMYQNLDGKLLTVHMCDWPKGDESRVNPQIEKEMVNVRQIVDDVSKARQSKGLKLRWPVREVVIKCKDGESAEGLKAFETILMEKLNTKKLQILKPNEEWSGLTLEVKPNPEAIGKTYRQWASRIAVILESRPPGIIKEEIDKGEYSLGIDGQLIQILPSMGSFIRNVPKNTVLVEGDYGSVYMDIESTPEIISEGFSREVVRRIQEMRKEVDMDVEDFLKTQVQADDRILDYLREWKDFIAFETSSRSLE
ncbi:MAG: class I tRNA ligase family protein, partial [Thermoplasmata archaeon]|nr:class I tRNA ligase family protein [Thermoplasmata archaeon]